MQYIAQQLQNISCNNLRIVLGMVNDKDISGVLSLLPRHARYYFTQASVERALPAQEVARIAMQYGLLGECYDTVASAYKAAIIDAKDDDMIFVGGSTFIVADLLKLTSK